MRILILVLILSSSGAWAGSVCDAQDAPTLHGGDLPFPFAGHWDLTGIAPLMRYKAVNGSQHLAVYPVPQSRSTRYVIIEWQDPVAARTLQGQAIWVGQNLEGLFETQKESIAFLIDTRANAIWLEKQCSALIRE